MMTILNAQTLPKHGPNIQFAALPSRLDIDEWPSVELYREYTFFEWPDDLLGTICSLTHTDLFFDEYDFTQHYRPDQIYRFTSEILTMASRIATCPVCYFDSEIRLYEDSMVEPEYRTGTNLKADILETLMYVAMKAVDTAQNGKCLAIVGI
jgi:hypothetical protein